MLHSHPHSRSLVTKGQNIRARRDQPRGPQLLQTHCWCCLYMKARQASPWCSGSVLLVWALIFMRAISEAKTIAVSRPFTCCRFDGGTGEWKKIPFVSITSPNHGRLPKDITSVNSSWSWHRSLAYWADLACERFSLSSNSKSITSVKIPSLVFYKLNHPQQN